jgi:hypothetical protein
VFSFIVCCYNSRSRLTATLAQLGAVVDKTDLPPDLRGRRLLRSVVGQHVGYEAQGNVVQTHSAEDVVVTVGVHDLVIVKHGHTVVLMAKDRVADIKRVLEDERLGGGG